MTSVFQNKTFTGGPSRVFEWNTNPFLSFPLRNVCPIQNCGNYKAITVSYCWFFWEYMRSCVVKALWLKKRVKVLISRCSSIQLHYLCMNIKASLIWRLIQLHSEQSVYSEHEFIFTFQRLLLYLQFLSQNKCLQFFKKKHSSL